MRRETIAFREWSQAQRLLYKYGTTNRDIADHSGVPLSSVSRALSLRFCHKTSHGIVLRVRRSVQILLMQADGGFGNFALWNEYDAQALDQHRQAS